MSYIALTRFADLQDGTFMRRGTSTPATALMCPMRETPAKSAEAPKGARRARKKG